MEILTTIKNDAIRRQWDEKNGKWYFSIADSVGIVAKSTDARNYWKVLKSRLKKAQNELVTKCNQLKMKSADGKMYLTDVGDEETILEIIQLISKENLSLFRDYFYNLRNEEVETPKEKVRSLDINKRVIIESPKNESLAYPQIKVKDTENSENEYEEGEEEFMLMIDAYTTVDSIVVKTFIAGINIEDLIISIIPEELFIAGERVKNSVSEESYEEQELYWGKFSRTIKLPYEVEVESVEATEKDGLLTVRLPLVNLLYTKKVKIKSI